MNPPLRVCWSAGMIQGGKSGVGRYVIQVARRLARSPGIELTMAGLAEDRRHFPDLDGTRWIPIPAWATRGAANLLWHQSHFPRLLRGRFDLLHIPSYRRILARSPIPQVATIHDCAVFHLEDKYDAARGWFGRHAVPRLARSCDHVVAVSQHAAQDIQRYLGVDPARLTVIHNGLDPAACFPPRPEAVARLRERMSLGNRPYFLYVSRLEHPAKNHLRLIEAFDRWRVQSGSDALLVLAGGDWHGAEVIRAAAAAAAHAEDIRLMGFVDDADLPAWYGGAIGLVFPSLMEGFGLPVIEAQACACPVAVARATSLPEVAGPHSEVFEPMDVPDIAQALARLAGLHGETREHRIAEGLRWADGFSWDTHARRLLGLYAGLAATGRKDHAAP